MGKTLWSLGRSEYNGVKRDSVYIKDSYKIYFIFSDGVKYKLIQMHDGKIFVKLVTLATLSNDAEVQYNSAGTLGQLALIGKKSK